MIAGFEALSYAGNRDAGYLDADWVQGSMPPAPAAPTPYSKSGPRGPFSLERVKGIKPSS
jgi:hypothetical protein